MLSAVHLHEVFRHVSLFCGVSVECPKREREGMDAYGFPPYVHDMQSCVYLMPFGEFHRWLQ